MITINRKDTILHLTALPASANSMCDHLVNMFEDCAKCQWIEDEAIRRTQADIENMRQTWLSRSELTA